jgi:hypothetical protein
MQRTGSLTADKIDDDREDFSIRRAFVRSVADEYASALVFVRLIFLHLESFLALAIAIASPCFFHFYRLDGKTLSFTLSWTMVRLPLSVGLFKKLTKWQLIESYHPLIFSDIKSC